MNFSSVTLSICSFAPETSVNLGNVSKRLPRQGSQGSLGKPTVFRPSQLFCQFLFSLSSVPFLLQMDELSNLQLEIYTLEKLLRSTNKILKSLCCGGCECGQTNGQQAKRQKHSIDEHLGSDQLHSGNTHSGSLSDTLGMDFLVYATENLVRVNCYLPFLRVMLFGAKDLFHHRKPTAVQWWQH